MFSNLKSNSPQEVVVLIKIMILLRCRNSKRNVEVKSLCPWPPEMENVYTGWQRYRNIPCNVYTEWQRYRNIPCSVYTEWQRYRNIPCNMYAKWQISEYTLQCVYKATDIGICPAICMKDDWYLNIPCTVYTGYIRVYMYIGLYSKVAWLEFRPWIIEGLLRNSFETHNLIHYNLRPNEEER